MSSNIFEFQQFKIRQDKTAMKIGTDGVLIGAYCNFSSSKKILDIGTGTGLISLMAAQKSNAQVIAIEIDNDAFEQAKNNFEQSKFKNRIKIINCDFLKFDFSELSNEKCKFDYIVSNPPFFVNSLKSENNKRNLARHSDAMPFKKMIEKVATIIEENGIFSVIIPFTECLEFVKNCALNKLHLFNKTKILSKRNSNAFRVILSFSKQILPLTQNEITIYNNEGKYSKEYKLLTQDFYLK